MRRDADSVTEGTCENARDGADVGWVGMHERLACSSGGERVVMAVTTLLLQAIIVDDGRKVESKMHSPCLG